LNYVVASGSALSNPKKEAAIADLVQRLAKAQDYVVQHPAVYAPVFAKVNSIPPGVATDVLGKLRVVYVPITNPIEAAQQSEADIFHQLKLISSKLNTALEFDTRFNSLVAAATGSSGPTS
jgi:sulfonate transport system substrate-binding protein